MAAAIGCQVGEMPFTYLGLPLGTTRPTIQEYLPLMNRIERMMMGINRLLSYTGRLIMVNSVLSALPTFYLCTFIFHKGVIDQIDRYRKYQLWCNGDMNKKGGCLVAWEVACRPKDQGGLGIIDLQAQNSAHHYRKFTIMRTFHGSL